MIEAILIDDETHCLDTLHILLQDNCPEVKILDKCRSAKAGLEAIEKLRPTLVFLDIEMPGMNGFEMLEHLKEVPFYIIFTTSYDQYAIKAIHFSALEYLLKPIILKELIAAIYKVQLRTQLPAVEQFRMLLAHVRHKETGFTKIAVPTAEGFELIPSEQVLRCEANDNYTSVILKNKRRIVACRTLKDIEEQLQVFSFFIRIHHSYIVNINEVTKYVRGEGGYVIMSDSTSVNVSRSRKEMLLQKLQPGKI